MVDNVINNSQSFEYTYSAKRQKEMESIKKYLPKEDKMAMLRKKDK